MMVLVSYDVSTITKRGQKRLRRVAKICENYGQRVQYSMFECIVDPGQWVQVKNQLIAEIDEEKDSLRFYYLGANWKKSIEHVGAKSTLDQEGPLII
ncbi:MAG: CRISPR-associated endonuclease Cas2 [Deltaproteobacteria bacterium]|nr:CRISPR-associated endonuclease Cas2 [Deltaproteobacteria bacterium]